MALHRPHVRSRHQTPTVIPFSSKGFGSYWPKLCFCMATSGPCAHHKIAGAPAVFVAAEAELVQTEGGTRSSRDERPQASVGTSLPFDPLCLEGSLWQSVGRRYEDDSLGRELSWLARQIRNSLREGGGRLTQREQVWLL
jgi:hypothetical protein